MKFKKPLLMTIGLSLFLGNALAITNKQTTNVKAEEDNPIFTYKTNTILNVLEKSLDIDNLDIFLNDYINDEDYQTKYPVSIDEEHTFSSLDEAKQYTSIYLLDYYRLMDENINKRDIDKARSVADFFVMNRDYVLEIIDSIDNNDLDEATLNINGVYEELATRISDEGSTLINHFASFKEYFDKDALLVKENKDISADSYKDIYNYDKVLINYQELEYVDLDLILKGWVNSSYETNYEEDEFVMQNCVKFLRFGDVEFDRIFDVAFKVIFEEEIQWDELDTSQKRQFIIDHTSGDVEISGLVVQLMEQEEREITFIKEIIRKMNKNHLLIKGFLEYGFLEDNSMALLKGFINESISMIYKTFDIYEAIEAQDYVNTFKLLDDVSEETNSLLEYCYKKDPNSYDEEDSDIEMLFAKEFIEIKTFYKLKSVWSFDGTYDEELMQYIHEEIEQLKYVKRLKELNGLEEAIINDILLKRSSIISFTKVSSENNVDTYVITLNNGAEFTFQVTNSVAPQIRINEETGFWEISINEGETWISLDTKAIGVDGKDGVSPKVTIPYVISGVSLAVALVSLISVLVIKSKNKSL